MPETNNISQENHSIKSNILNLSYKDLQGNNTLHFAVTKNYTQYVKDLLSNSQNSDDTIADSIIAQNDVGHTPLHLAILNKVDTVIITLLLFYANKLGVFNKLMSIANNINLSAHELINQLIFTNQWLQQCNKFHLTALSYIQKHCEINRLKARNMSLDHFQQYIQVATEHSDLESIRFLYLEARNSQGNTYLHNAIINNSVLSIKNLFSTYQYDIDVIEALLTAKNDEGNTPLHLAILRKVDTVIITFLLFHALKASILYKLATIKNNINLYPLELIHNLLISNQLPYIYNSFLVTTLSYLLKYIEIDKTLGDIVSLDHFEKYLLLANKQNDIDSFTFLMIDARNLDGNSLLHLAVVNNNHKIVKNLLFTYKYFNPTIEFLITSQNTNHNTPLHLAIIHQANSAIINEILQYAKQVDASSTLLYMQNSQNLTAPELLNDLIKQLSDSNTESEALTEYREILDSMNNSMNDTTPQFVQQEVLKRETNVLQEETREPQNI